MRDRLKKVQRIVSVHKQLRQLTEWKIASLRREEMRLEQDQEKLIDSLNSDALHHGLFVAAMAKRLSALSTERANVRDSERAMQEKLVEDSVRLKAVERVARHVEQSYDAHQESKQLTAIVEQSVSADSASFRKA